MFAKLFLGESKKLIKPKGLIAIAVIFVVFFIVYAVSYNYYDEIRQTAEDVLGSISGDYDLGYGEDGEEISVDEWVSIFGYDSIDFIAYANPENIDDIIAYFNKNLEECKTLNKQKDKRGDYADSIYYYKGIIKILEYMKANNVYGAIEVEGYNAAYSWSKSAEGFTYKNFNLILTMMIIYGIVIGAGMYAEEYSRGTIKLVMLRPVGRNTLTTAKLLALYAHLVALLGSMTLISYIYGAIAFKNVSSTPLYVVFNAMSVFKSTVGGMLLCKMFFGMISMLSMATLSFSAGTVLRKKTPALLIALFTSLGMVRLIFMVFKGNNFLYSATTDLSIYFGLSRTMSVGADFFIALPLYIVYTAAIVTTMYLIVKKRDIA